MPNVKRKISRYQKPLFICATHGDEEFSIPVVESLAEEYNFDWVIGNPRALKQGVRFTETDLNRSAPGNFKSKRYEERRAAKIVKYARPYPVTIDLHGTVSDCGLFLILSDASWENIELAKKFNIKRVLLWSSLRPIGPLTQIIRPGLEIECGPKDDPKTAESLEKVLEQFLQGKKPRIKQEFYIVTGQRKGKNNPRLKDFTLTEEYDFPFYPILSGNQYPGITCYIAQKLRDTL